MQHSIENALDILVSPRSSIEVQKDALTTLERTIAILLFDEKGRHGQGNIDEFLQIQDSFQYNLASRIHCWLAYRTEALSKLGDRKTCSASDSQEESSEISSLVIQALSLLQGVALMHRPSKEFLCRTHSLEVFIDLLAICRSASARPFGNSTNISPTKSGSVDRAWDPSLASAVLDTLLCVLVDAPTALRWFEDAKGIEHVVKILKRPAIPKDVRIKCLEFLYFYLMDESGSTLNSSLEGSSTSERLAKVAYFDHSRIPTDSSSGSGSSKSSSGSAFSSWSPTPTLAGTPPISPKKPSRELPQPNGRLDMLRKEVDFVPQSPKRAKVAQLNGGMRRPGTPRQASPVKNLNADRRTKHQPSPVGRLASEETLLSESDVESTVCGDRRSLSVDEGTATDSRIRTIEEKKAILGQLLGNVDALVEGVKKAGIWGLGE
ncbi:uncharacterized protein FOMMEDRAFT_158069 [Fomitiporia mediterranea MF3/22]|uniref:uncharacterized protein n=1 Tax=Fomitiporia mediterranea (strain MF3/22) TaxID=694068 RepID=UPI0004407599|nr:uncharacterized protein FOMMEDRAFT_158069 [Fomitiporia mediterranea MF3/22]EJD00952.1 hypothetical protein FOMMEDRAFT_158069 [Fomitiporia mediterranea MF3/22]